MQYGTKATYGVLADSNQDGAIDLAAASAASSVISVDLAVPRDLSTREQVDLNRQQSALESLQERLSRIAMERGAVGPVQSRLPVVNSTLQSSCQKFKAAASRISDAAVAEEPSQLIRQQILQHAGKKLYLYQLIKSQH